MAALGRILQVVGWLWFGVAVAGAIFGFGDFEIFPGLILVFVARALRTGARRRQGDDDTSQVDPAAAHPERVLNTERQTRPPPAIRSEPSTVIVPAPAPKKRNELLETIVESGHQAAKTEEAPDEPGDKPTQAMPEPDHDRREPKTSDEMIAEARRRWDRK
jgi:hypothetical protein